MLSSYLALPCPVLSYLVLSCPIFGLLEFFQKAEIHPMMHQRGSGICPAMALDYAGCYCQMREF